MTTKTPHQPTEKAQAPELWSAVVGRGRAEHMSTRNDETLCGKPVTRYVSGDECIGLKPCGGCWRVYLSRWADPLDEQTVTSAATTFEPIPDLTVPQHRRRTAQQQGTISVAVNAFEQAVAGLLDPKPAGRYTLQVCDETLNVCDRGACTLHSTRAAGTLDEVRAASALYRHAWAVSPSGERIPLTEQPVPAAAEQTPVEDLPDGPMRVRVRMGFSREDLDRIKAEADAARAVFEAESAARRAAERAKYGPKDEAQQAPVEGTVVAHRGEARGSLPKHADHPDVRAALDVLTDHGKRRTLRLAALQGDDVETNLHATGVMVEPRGEGLVALYWLVDGQYADERGGPWRVQLEIIADRMRAADWLIEAGTGPVVKAWRLYEHAPVEVPEESEPAPRCRECSGRGCNFCDFTGENHLG
ncbi:hypothetical protein [Kitasatospora sp. NBC_01300]|uniref:hypothetical protein n=1 Tax=Kitasatospora sp. NBC_01300 TaxID=2903574 RepID=UPI00352F6B43|nr:hypothetical protein OG556_18410 [Kitasatospora sp. NBC_01300]